MHERGKAGEGVLFECQTCEKKNLCSKKNFRKNFLEIFFIESYFLIYFELFCHFLPFLYYKNLVRINLGIRIKKSQCAPLAALTWLASHITTVPTTTGTHDSVICLEIFWPLTAIYFWLLLEVAILHRPQCTVNTFFSKLFIF